MILGNTSFQKVSLIEMDTLPAEMVAYLVSFLDEVSAVLARLVCQEWSERLPVVRLPPFQLQCILIKTQNISILEKLWGSRLCKDTDWYSEAINFGSSELRKWLCTRARPKKSAYFYAKKCVECDDIDGLRFHLEGVNLDYHQSLGLFGLAITHDQLEMIDMLGGLKRFIGDAFRYGKYVNKNDLLYFLSLHWESIADVEEYALRLHKVQPGLRIYAEEVRSQRALEFLHSHDMIDETPSSEMVIWEN